MPILRHACRSIRRTPLLASVIVSSLGIGIGANAVVFSWIEPAVLRPIAGVKKSSSLYWIEPRTDTGSYPGASWREFQDLGDRLRTLRDLLAFRMLPLHLGESAASNARTVCSSRATIFPRSAGAGTIFHSRGCRASR